MSFFLPEAAVKVRFVDASAALVATRQHVSLVAVGADEASASQRVQTWRVSVSSDVQDACAVGATNVCVAESNGDLSLWATTDHRPLLARVAHAHAGAASCVAAQRRTGRLVSAGDDGRIVVRQDAHWATHAPLATFDGDGAAITRVAFDGDDGDGLLSTNVVGQLCFWDARQRSDRPVKSMRDGTSGAELWSLAAHPARPSVVATGAADGSVSLWDTRAALWPVSRSLAHNGAVWDLAFSALGDRLVSVGNDGSCLQWDVGASSAVTELFPPHEAPLYSVDAHAASNVVLCAGASGCVLTAQLQETR
jgi:WD40 repeat protein